MPRSKARVKQIFGELVLIKKNPWYHPRLLKALLSIGKRPKKPELILASPPPWFMNPSAMPKGVYERAKLFSQVASETAGQTIEERLKTIQNELKLPPEERKPRPSKAKKPGKRFHELYPTYEALRGVAPAPAPAPVAPPAKPKAQTFSE